MHHVGERHRFEDFPAWGVGEVVKVGPGSRLELFCFPGGWKKVDSERARLLSNEGTGCPKALEILREVRDKPRSSNVYVIELDKLVLHVRKFRDENPGYDGVSPAVYVGMTDCDVEERFQQHLAGYRANRYAKKFGQRLLKELFSSFNPMPRELAKVIEVELAQHLRDEGLAAWQN